METNTKTVPIIQKKDRNAIYLELMNRMNLHGMASVFKESLQSQGYRVRIFSPFL